MSIVDDAEYKNALRSCWSIETDFAKWFPDEIAEWIQYQSTILGVAQPYLSIPLLVAVSYCSHQCSVTAGANHTEPLILYGLVVGRSGTNKSAALHKILDIVKSIEVSESHTFESGTMEGLMVAMRENEESILAVYDEFSSFYDSLDKGTAGKCEKSRFLTLYNGKPWSKKTKTNGTMEIDSPRYNMLAFTQPSYAVQFAKTNTSDGFYQRFLLSVPKEKFVKFNDKRECLNNKKELLDLESVIKRIYEACRNKMELEFTDAANRIYEQLHDEVIEYRQKDEFEEAKSSIKSKSIGLFLRISGLIFLMRKCLSDDPGFGESNKIEAADALMSLQIVNYSVQNAFCLVPPKFNQSDVVTSRKSTMKTPLPEPENLSVEYLQQYQKVTKRLLQHDTVPLTKITKDKVYPIINDTSGSQVASKFVRGLQQLGFGKITPTSKHFKRFHPDDENCPDRESLRKKYKLLNLN